MFTYCPNDYKMSIQIVEDMKWLVRGLRISYFFRQYSTYFVGQKNVTTTAKLLIMIKKTLYSTGMM